MTPTKDEPLTNSAVDSVEATRLATLFKPLSDPSRVALFSAMADGETCVHELADRFDMEQSAVSHQLRTLRDQHLVTTRRQGRHIFYSLADSHVQAIFHFALQHLRHTNPETRHTRA